jgi:hypothetical protein
MSNINRRKALTVVAAVPAAMALATPALAVEEDAKLKRLWAEWNAQWLVCEQASKLHDEAEGKVFEAAGPYWDFVAVKGSKPYRAVFISSAHDDVSQKIIALKAKTYHQAREEAAKAGEGLRSEREDRKRTAQRKYRFTSAERAHNAANRRLSEIEDAIAETPAEGMTGMAIKLAVWKVFNRGEAYENDHELIASLYDSAVNLSGGFDFAAQVRRW